MRVAIFTHLMEFLKLGFKCYTIFLFSTAPALRVHSHSAALCCHKNSMGGEIEWRFNDNYPTLPYYVRTLQSTRRVKHKVTVWVLVLLFADQETPYM